MSNDTNPPDPPETPDNPALKDQEYVSKVIKNFINAEGDADKSGGAGAPVAAGKKFHDRRDIIKALTTMQTTYKSEYVAGQKVNINTDDFKLSLLNNMAKLSNTVNTRSLSQIDGRTIDFVEMLFGAFLRDPNISPAVKNLLLQLQIPLIKVALLDNTFFHNNKHPARNVLDTMAHLGIGIEDRENTLYKTMELIIDQLQTSFDQNLASFNTALLALGRLTNIEKKKTDQKESETQQEIIKEHARHVILTELKHQTKGRTIPQNINPLILKHWSNFMLQQFMQHGKNSDQWNNAVDLLIQLVSSIQPITNKLRLLMLKNSSAELINRLRQDLYGTRQDKSSIDTCLQALQEHHNKLMLDTSADGNKPEAPAEPEKESISEADIKAEAQRIADENLRISKEHLAKLPKDVKVGAWFEIFNGTENIIRRLKLSLILFDEAKLVFVDRVGNKVLEKHATELLDELQTNRSRLLADHSIFNHALGHVITSLASKQPEQGSTK